MAEKQSQGFKEAAGRWFHALDSPLAFVVVVFTLAGIYFGVVEWRVGSIVRDPDFLSEVAHRVRPAMVFDSEGRILGDTGGLAFLDGVPEVEPAPKGETGYHTKITVRPKGFLASEPIIESLDLGGVSITAKRTKGTAWEVLVANREQLLAIDEQPRQLSPVRYRLEINPPQSQ